LHHTFVQTLGAFPLIASTGLAFRKQAVIAHLGRVLGSMALHTEHLVRIGDSDSGAGRPSEWQLVSHDAPAFVFAALVAAACWVVAMLLLFAWIMRVALQCDDAAAHPQVVAAATTAAATSWQAKARLCALPACVLPCVNYASRCLPSQVLRVQLLLSSTVLLLPVSTALCRALECGGKVAHWQPAGSQLEHRWAGTGWTCWGGEHAVIVAGSLLLLAVFGAVATLGKKVLAS
jgi:hypothetical protein